MSEITAAAMSETTAMSQTTAMGETIAPVQTPCIGICSTTSFGDTVCRGCKRYAFEVIHWHAYDEAAKRAVQARIEGLMIQSMEGKLRIFSVPNLQQGLQRFKISFDPGLSPYCWLHDLLKKAHRHIERLDDYGVYVREDYAAMPLDELCELIDRELLLLCDAHYERYIRLTD